MSENGEEFTPREEAQQKVERFSADLWWTAKALVALRADPLSRDFFGDRSIADIERAKINLDVLVSELRAMSREAA